MWWPDILLVHIKLLERRESRAKRCTTQQMVALPRIVCREEGDCERRSANLRILTQEQLVPLTGHDAQERSRKRDLHDRSVTDVVWVQVDFELQMRRGPAIAYHAYNIVSRVQVRGRGY